jgi:sortase (surface protein transpeptidase)
VSSAHPPVRRPGTRPDSARLGRLGRPARLALVVPAALTVLAGCSSASHTASPASRPATLAPVAAGTPSTKAPDKPPAPPTKVAIPSVGIATSLMKLGLNADGTVEVPPADKGMTAGWYTGGSVPGEAGAAVIIGHNDTRFGKAVFHDLHKIAKGADITVTNSLGKPAHFTVTGTESISKTSFPTQKVYGPTKAHVLRLITCDGDFDAQGHPVNNLIVYATLS